MLSIAFCSNTAFKAPSISAVGSHYLLSPQMLKSILRTICRTICLGYKKLKQGGGGGGNGKRDGPGLVAADQYMGVGGGGWGGGCRTAGWVVNQKHNIKQSINQSSVIYVMVWSGQRTRHRQRSQ